VNNSLATTAKAVLEFEQRRRVYCPAFTITGSDTVSGSYAIHTEPDVAIDTLPRRHGRHDHHR
jgi:hypothetical protein